MAGGGSSRATWAADTSGGEMPAGGHAAVGGAAIGDTAGGAIGAATAGAIKGDNMAGEAIAVEPSGERASGAGNGAAPPNGDGGAAGCGASASMETRPGVPPRKKSRLAKLPAGRKTPRLPLGSASTG